MYSGEINTRISAQHKQCNDEITDQNPNEGANKAVKPRGIDCALFVDCCICRHSSVRIFLDLLIYAKTNYVTRTLNPAGNM